MNHTGKSNGVVPKKKAPKTKKILDPGDDFSDELGDVGDTSPASIAPELTTIQCYRLVCGALLSLPTTPLWARAGLPLFEHDEGSELAQLGDLTVAIAEKIRRGQPHGPDACVSDLTADLDLDALVAEAKAYAQDYAGDFGEFAERLLRDEKKLKYADLAARAKQFAASGEAAGFGQFILDAQDLHTGGEPQVKPPPARTQAEWYTTVAAEEETWLIQEWLTAVDSIFLCGKQKTLKTHVLTDLVVAVASGGKFLGKLGDDEAPPRTVMICSHESGNKVLQRAVQAICEDREIEDPTQLPLYWHTLTPVRLTLKGLDWYKHELDRTKAEVLTIDPLMLVSDLDVDPNKKDEVAQMLEGITSVCRERNCTPVFAVHERKGRYEGDVLDPLERISGAGIAQFARQWIMLARRQAYEHDKLHRLWLELGSSTGGESGKWAFDVRQGTRKNPLWSVERFLTASEHELAIAEEKLEAKDSQAAQEQHQLWSQIQLYLGAAQGPVSHTELSSVIHKSHVSAHGFFAPLIANGSLAVSLVGKGKYYSLGTHQNVPISSQNSLAEEDDF